MSGTNGTATKEPPTATTAMAANERKPLWPNGMSIPVIGLTGDFATGKTIFGLSIAPGPDTFVYDTEKSSEIYQPSLGFGRIDIPSAMLAKHKSGYKPIDAFLWWRDHFRTIASGKYRVIMLDTVSEVETGLVEYVRKNPGEFGYTPGQFARAEALMWGAVKDYWLMLLNELTSRCETFVFTSHLRQVFKDGRPVQGKKAPKGKETLMQIASLYLELQRPKDTKGNVQEIPSAIKIKSRVSQPRVVDGEFQIVDLLPPRLPIATPTAIRNYILNPPNHAKLRKDELAPDAEFTEDERAAIKLATAEAERDAEALRNERLNRAANATASTPTSTASTTPTTPTTAQPSPTKSAAELQTERDYGKPDQPVHPFGDGPTVAMLSNLKAYKTHLGISDEQWKAILAKRGVDTAKKLSNQQAEELVAVLAQKYSDKIRKEKEAKEVAAAGN